ncbi:MAG: coproporphyrinogen III oxidase family protein [Sulfurospirillum sp.]|nr:coproporphyrinogen III oxidase family protein [Sulfurospirillum sp.]
MLQEVFQKSAVFVAKKIVQKAMKSQLKITRVNQEIQRKFDKNKKYLLYIHIPFCHTFCPFCSFHKFKYDEDLAHKYFKSLRLELQKVHDEGFAFDSLYIGGGTTLINEPELLQTITFAKQLFEITEVSCESDPNHIDPEKLKIFEGYIDRLSIGVQSFDDTILHKVLRYEKFGSGDVIEKKLKAMAKIFPNTNIDLIFNFPGQTKEMLVRDLQIAKNLGVSQITLYPLMNSNLTSATMYDAFGANTSDKEYAFYTIIQEQMLDFEKNNAWSFSKNKTAFNDEYVGAHEEYIGVGSGAFSFLGGNLFVNAFDLEEYASLVSKRSHAIIAQSSFAQKDQLKYHFLTWLFNGTINIQNFEKTFGTVMKKSLKFELAMLKLTKSIKIEDGVITTTAFGDYLALCMMKEFYSGMDTVRAMFRQNLFVHVKEGKKIQ